MQKSTITLTPVPSGATLLSEGDQDDLLYIVEGGRLSLERGGRRVAEVGGGGLVGAAGVVLGTPQLFTVTGADRTSFAKKLVAVSLEELMAEDEELFPRLHASMEAEIALVEALLIAAELEATPGRLAAIRSERSKELGREIAKSGGPDPVGEVFGNATGADLPPAASFGTLLSVAGVFRTVRAAAEIGALASGDRERRGLELLKERAQVLAGLCSRMS